MFVTLWNYKVCDNGNAIKQCNFQNNYGTVAYRKVSSCAPIFNFFCGPQTFSTGENLYQKLQFFASFAAVGPHFVSQNGEIWYDDADLRLPPTSQILHKKNRVRGIPLLGKCIPKNTNFGDLGAVAHILKPTMVKFGMRVRTRNSIPKPTFVKIA